MGWPLAWGYKGPRSSLVPAIKDYMTLGELLTIFSLGFLIFAMTRLHFLGLPEGQGYTGLLQMYWVSPCSPSCSEVALSLLSSSGKPAMTRCRKSSSTMGGVGPSDMVGSNRIVSPPVPWLAPDLMAQ